MRNPNHAITKAAVKCILLRAETFSWSIQGLGMLRLYIDDGMRLHVWSRSHAVENASTLHDHPWHFRSVIVAGELYNRRYTRIDIDDGDTRGAGPEICDRYLEQTIQCGPGGYLKNTPLLVGLQPQRLERYTEGDNYFQGRTEIHQSEPVDGTVTIIERTAGVDPDHARVYWPEGTEWVSAEPRPATPDEVRAITANALKRWF